MGSYKNRISFHWFGLKFVSVIQETLNFIQVVVA